jgi:hypothetical protein
VEEVAEIVKERLRQAQKIHRLTRGRHLERYLALSLDEPIELSKRRVEEWAQSHNWAPPTP